MDKHKITYEDTWYKVDSDTGKTTKIDQPRASRSSSPVDDFLENFLKNKVIAFGKTPEIIENVKEMQRNWLTYITEIHAFEGKSIKKLKDSLPDNNKQLIENHAEQFFDGKNKQYRDKVGLLRAIGKNYLTELQKHLNQFKKQTGGKKRKESKHRKRRKSRTKRRKKKTKKRRKKIIAFKRNVKCPKGYDKGIQQDGSKYKTLCIRKTSRKKRYKFKRKSRRKRRR